MCLRPYLEASIFIGTCEQNERSVSFPPGSSRLVSLLFLHPVSAAYLIVLLFLLSFFCRPQELSLRLQSSRRSLSVSIYIHLDVGIDMARYIILTRLTEHTETHAALFPCRLPCLLPILPLRCLEENTKEHAGRVTHPRIYHREGERKR